MKRYLSLWFWKSLQWSLMTIILMSPLTVWAETFTVTRMDDFNFPSGTPSGIEYCLRTAILAANQHPGPDTIVLGSGTHKLDIGGAGEDKGLTGDLDITEDLTIKGKDQKATIIDGGALDRVFQVHPNVSCSMWNLTITNGREAVDNDLSGGGGIYVHSSATLNLHRVTVTRNLVVGNNKLAAVGGGLKCIGHCNLNDTTVSENYAQHGGGIYNGINATLRFYRSTLAMNIAYLSGGGATVRGAAVFENSTVYGNRASYTGGALYLNTAEIRFCTITRNNSGDAPWGGAIEIGDSETVTIHNSIVANNTLNDAETQANCSHQVPFHSESSNIDGGNSCGFNAGGSYNNTDPLLNDLTDNGGPTLTCMPKSGSLAIDHAQNTSLAVDQRSYYRKAGLSPDIGSVETGSSPKFFKKASIFKVKKTPHLK